MNNYDRTYREMTKHLMRKQHIKEGISFLVSLVLIVGFVLLVLKAVEIAAL